MGRGGPIRNSNMKITIDKFMIINDMKNILHNAWSKEKTGGIK